MSTDQLTVTTDQLTVLAGRSVLVADIIVRMCRRSAADAVKMDPLNCAAGNRRDLRVLS